MILGIDASRTTHETSTGVEVYSEKIITHLLKLLVKNPYGFEKVRLYAKQHVILPEDLRVSFIEQRILHAPRFWTLARLSREMRENPVDRLFVPSHVLPLVQPNFSVITIHDVAFRYLRSSYSFFQYHYLDWSTKYAVKHAKKIIVPSEATKEDLVKFYKCPSEKIVMIPHGFEASILPKDVRTVHQILESFGVKDVPYVFFVGRLELKKNIHRLLQAFSLFLEKNPDFKLILIGKRGQGFDRILRIAQKLDIWDRILMPGYVDEYEKHVLFSHCEFFAFPSLYEGFGFPILEAFHYGKPVLTSNVSSMPEVSSDAAYLVDPFSVESIAQGLEALAQDEKLRSSLREKGKCQLEKFSWHTAARKTLEVLIGS